MKITETDNDKIPIEEVLDAMYNPNGGIVTQAARDYFYNNYATDDERKRIDCEEKMRNIFCYIFLIIYITLIIIALIA